MCLSDRNSHPASFQTSSQIIAIMSLDDSTEVDVRKSLEGTRFEATSLTKLTGGTANWIFVAKLASSLDDGTPEVLVKLGQGFSASNPTFKLTLHRCVSCLSCKDADSA